MVSSKSKKSKMDFMDLDSYNLSAADWPLTSEVGQFNAFVSGTQGNDENVTTSQSSSYSQASFLLSEPWEFQEPDSTYSGWQEEPMDLEVFAQSVDTWRQQADSGLEFDEISSIPSSPASAPTPIYPSSPIGLHLTQAQVTSDKLGEQTGIAAVESSSEFFDSFVLSPSQFQPLDSTATSSPVEQQEDILAAQVYQDDDASALLDELLQGVMEKGEPLVDISTFSALMEELENDSPNQEPEQTLTINVIIDSSSDLQVDSVSVEESNTSESDAEWKPEPAVKRRKVQATGRTSSRAQKSSDKQEIVAQSTGRSVRQRKKDLPMEDRRLRKKEQNKTAATRYRQKKKAELEILLDEETSLLKRNKELKLKFDEMSKEVSYLKNLMREVLLAQRKQP